MAASELSRAWRKSSYSQPAGDNCLECSSAAWHTSPYSGSNMNCLQYAHLPSTIAVRDSKHPDEGHLSFPGSEWSAFLTAVKGARL